MSELVILCRNATTFNTAGELDEDAFRQYLQRLIDSKIGVYLASGGSGEGHALTHEELGCVYRIGVETCKGKVQVNGNPPDQHTARATLEHALYAVACGVEIVNLYGPAGWHGFKPTDDEYRAYFDFVLSALKHPVALAPNPVMGYTPKPSVIADICRKYPQVVAVNFAGVKDDGYFIELKASVRSDIAFNVTVAGTPNTFTMGAAGLIGNEANLLPRTMRRLVNAYEADKPVEMVAAYKEIKRVTDYVTKWHSVAPRWIKMALKVFKLPGGEGGVRAPYLMPGEAERDRFAAGLIKLDVPEINELARAAGLTG